MHGVVIGSVNAHGVPKSTYSRAPGRFGTVPWDSNGTLVVGTSPRYQEGVDPKRRLATQAIEDVRKDGLDQ